MTQGPQRHDVDGLRRFLFEHHPLRGFWLRLERTWSDALEHQPHPPEVRQLVGESMAAAALLAATLKFDGTLALQIDGDGPLRLLVTQSTHELGLRAVAQLEQGANVAGSDFRGLVGDARLTVSVEGWQGVVPLTGDSLAHSLEAYFATSEQLPTRLLLAADGHRVGGLLLQKLPTPQRKGEAAEGLERELWDEAGALLATVRAEELLHVPPERLLTQVFAGHDLRLFEPHPVRFQCHCGTERVSSMLRSLGEEEVRDILAEQGSVTVTCEFCQRPYRFDAVDVEQLFRDGASPRGPGSLN